jgi:tRNA 2-(methylsulfanyl)-N6-isopentenyladenosine37 hydroxylase
MSLQAVLNEINEFLLCPTPDAWIEEALKQQDILLIDHANCEKKAANTAMTLLYRHLDRDDLLKKMSQLAREELLHFEQVVGIMKERGVHYRNLSSSR